MADSLTPEKVYIVKHLKLLIEKYKYKDIQPEMKGRNNLAWHNFTCNAIVDNIKYEVWITARKDDKEIFYYNHVPTF